MILQGLCSQPGNISLSFFCRFQKLSLMFDTVSDCPNDKQVLIHFLPETASLGWQGSAVCFPVPLTRRAPDQGPLQSLACNSCEYNKYSTGRQPAFINQGVCFLINNINILKYYHLLAARGEDSQTISRCKTLQCLMLWEYVLSNGNFEFCIPFWIIEYFE